MDSIDIARALREEGVAFYDVKITTSDFEDIKIHMGITDYENLCAKLIDPTKDKLLIRNLNGYSVVIPKSDIREIQGDLKQAKEFIINYG